VNFNAPADLVPLVVLTTAILGGILWLIRTQIAISKTLQPNGGTSVKDQLNRIESEVRDVRTKIDDHVTYHLNNDL
jgi:hypothetical protein